MKLNTKKCEVIHDYFFFKKYMYVAVNYETRKLPKERWSRVSLCSQLQDGGDALLEFCQGKDKYSS